MKETDRTDSRRRSKQGPVNVILKTIDDGFSLLTLLATFVVLFVWAFFAIQSVIGSSSQWWLIFGPIAVIAFLVLWQILLEAHEEFFAIPWVQATARVIAILRNALACVALIGLAQAITHATRVGGENEATQALQLFWRLISGDWGG